MAKNFDALVYLIIILMSAVLWAERPAWGDHTAVKTLVNDNTAFALDLYRHLHKGEENIFLSPYSVSTALAMTASGARGDTAEQMFSALHFTLVPEQINSAFDELENHLTAIRKAEGVELSIANALWSQQGYPFLEDFFKLVKNSYRAELKSVDFKTGYEAVRREINGWVEKQTHEKIKDLIKPGVLDRLTRMVLVNAIYFKGRWASQFEKNATKNSAFWRTKKTPIETPMMHQEQEYNYLEEDGLQILELPYEGNDLSMVILLPKKTNGLSDLEAGLSSEKLRSWLDGLRKRKINVYLPKFKITSQFSLTHTLMSMGMTDAFQPQAADFSGIDGTRNLYLSAVVHKAFVDVNEEGTEAAAATGAVISVTSMPESPPVFKADHPFVFLIRENRSGCLLFLGRLLDPEK
jgi:serpin B